MAGHAHTHTHSAWNNAHMTIHLMCTFLGWGREPEYAERIYTELVSMWDSSETVTLAGN